MRGNMADRKANNYLRVFLSIGSNLSEKTVAIDYNEHFHAPISLQSTQEFTTITFFMYISTLIFFAYLAFSQADLVPVPQRVEGDA